MAERGWMAVEVVYVAPEGLHRVSLRVPAGSTLGFAVSASGLLEQCPEVDPEVWGMGIFGRRREADCLLRPGDRVELYRPLLREPKEARRRRAAARDLGKAALGKAALGKAALGKATRGKAT